LTGTDAGARAQLPSRAALLAPWVGGLVIVLLGILVGLSPPWLIYDERAYMEGPYVLASGAGFRELMTTRLDITAGPLYAYIHYIASPVTGLTPPSMRYVNVALLVVLLWTLASTIEKLGYDHARSRAAMMLAVPMIGSTTGLALTEVPALALVGVACACVASCHGRQSRAYDLACYAIAGVCAGLAILGRQTYLPGLVGFVLIAAAVPRYRLACLLAIAIAGLIVAPLVVLWGGLTPPWQPNVASGINLQHGILAFVYLAVVAVLIAPGFVIEAYARPRLRLVGMAAIPATFLVAWLLELRFDVAQRVVNIFPASTEPLIQLAATSAMLAIAGLFGIAAAHHLWDRRADKRFLLLMGMTVLLNGTAVGIAHQFSSRYVLVSFPFALLALQPWIRANQWAAARIILGASLGMASLAAYYWNEPPLDPTLRSVAPPEIIQAMPPWTDPSQPHE